jgi:NadR type nicotinamide-nucleotide adenylyltransferase
MKRGLFLGKFMPFHLGHKLTADFALNWVDELVILVGSTDYEPINGLLRANIVREIYKDNTRVKVVHHHENLPQYPEEHPDFWNIWKNTINTYGDFDTVFSSELYGFKLAEILGADHIMVDRDRTLVPISGTAVRENIRENWHLLPPETQSAFSNRFCVVGPESTGKTTLSKKLSKHFNGIFLPEYGRTYYENKVLENPDYRYECKINEIEDIAKGHFLYEELVKNNFLVISDTDAIITKVFSEIYFGTTPKIVEECIEKRSDFYKHYIVTAPTVPWVSDGQRDLVSKRWDFYEMLLTLLTKHNRPFTIIETPNFNERTKQAIGIIEMKMGG